MNKLNLQPEYEHTDTVNSPEGVPASAVPGAGATAQPGDSAQRRARARRGAARLSLRSDDGFHLFRVY